jgi:hypothetical protein
LSWVHFIAAHAQERVETTSSVLRAASTTSSVFTENLVFDYLQRAGDQLHQCRPLRTQANGIAVAA